MCYIIFWKSTKSTTFLISDILTLLAQAGNIHQQSNRSNSGKHVTARVIAIEYYGKSLLHLINLRYIFTSKKHVKCQVFGWFNFFIEMIKTLTNWGVNGNKTKPICWKYNWAFPVFFIFKSIKNIVLHKKLEPLLVINQHFEHNHILMQCQILYKFDDLVARNKQFQFWIHKTRFKYETLIGGCCCCCRIFMRNRKFI